MKNIRTHFGSSLRTPRMSDLFAAARAAMADFNLATSDQPLIAAQAALTAFETADFDDVGANAWAELAYMSVAAETYAASQRLKTAANIASRVAAHQNLRAYAKHRARCISALEEARSRGARSRSPRKGDGKSASSFETDPQQDMDLTVPVTPPVDANKGKGKDKGGYDWIAANVREVPQPTPTRAKGSGQAVIHRSQFVRGSAAANEGWFGDGNQ